MTRLSPDRSRFTMHPDFRMQAFVLLILAFTAFFSPSVQAAPPAAAPPLLAPVYDIPANLTLCGERVPLERRDVWEMMDSGLISAVYSQAQVILWIKRSHRYFPYIEKRLKEKGLPDDLKYVVIAESALKTYAVSPARAVGPWQFMEGTAKRYGLRVDKWIDERRNFERSTDAALRYLSDLYRIHKSWALAIAAYNCGEGKVNKNMSMQGVGHYYDLDLPLETELYIFRVLAAKIILSYPEFYGYRIASERRYPPYDHDRVEINTSRETPIIAIAGICGTTFKAIKEMNPELKQDVIPPGRHHLNIPKGKAESFKARFGG